MISNQLLEEAAAEYNFVMGVSLMYAKTPEDAEDLAHDVYLKIGNLDDKNRWQDGKFKQWVHTVIRNAFINSKKRHRSLNVSPDMLEPFIYSNDFYGNSADPTELAFPESPDKVASRNDLSTVILESMNRLSESHRAILNMHYFEGLSHEEVANALGIPTGTARSRLFYAHKSLVSSYNAIMNRFKDEERLQPCQEA